MKTTILHYSAPPVIGGVEAVIQAHAEQFADFGMPVKIIAGCGEAEVFSDGVEFVRIPEMDTQHPEITSLTQVLNSGTLPDGFDDMVTRLADCLRPELQDSDNVIVHNILTKHFNLPLTVAILQLLNEGTIRHLIAWCHDLTWSSPNSRSKVFPAYPWDCLKTVHPKITYVAISEQRRDEIVETFSCGPEQVTIIHNGFTPNTLLSLSGKTANMIDRMQLLDADLVLLMPVRVTQAKNIEYAMQVIASIKTMQRQAKLIITGPPDPHDKMSMSYYHSLLDLRHRLDLEDAVHFVYESGPDPAVGNRIGTEEVAELYRLSDIMFMPSHREGFGMPVIEAGLLGIPIASTRVPAIQDLKLEDALIFSEDTPPEQFAKELLNWIDSKPEHRLKVNVRQNYSWKAIFEKRILPLLKAGQNND